MDADKIVSTIARVGMAQLSSCLGIDRLDRLAELGVAMTSHSIANAAFQEQGFDLFKNKELRLAILASLPIGDVTKLFGDLGLNRDYLSYANFKWGENESTRKFLAIFDTQLAEVFSNENKDLSFKVQSKVENSLFDYQNSIRKQLHAFLQNKAQKRIIVHMPTGTGKTRTTIEVISDFIRNQDGSRPPLVIWMAHSDELCEQAVQTFQNIWCRLGSEEASVYRLWGGRDGEGIDIDKPVFVVTSFQSCYSAMKSGKNERFRKIMHLRRKCDLLIVDEAHMSTAPTFNDAINFLCNERTQLVGLTATPGRHHVGGDVTETKKLAAFYNNNKITIDDNITDGVNPIEYLQERGILSKVDRTRLDSGIDIALSAQSVSAISNFLDIPKEVLAELGKSAKRTSKIAAATLMLSLDQNKQTIVFCPSKENATDLSLILQGKKCDARAITSDTPMAARRNWIEDFKSGDIKVLTNFGVLTTGFDAPNIEAVIVARPTVSVVLYSQMVGRGLRGSFVGGSEHCMLVDVIDNIKNMPQIPQAFTFFDDHFGTV